jgi:hypothetical protein
MIRISNLRHEGRPASIILRRYDNAVVNAPADVVKKAKDKLPNEAGQFRIKYLNNVDNAYTKTATFEPK